MLLSALFFLQHYQKTTLPIQAIPIEKKQNENKKVIEKIMRSLL